MWKKNRPAKKPSLEMHIKSPVSLNEQRIDTVMETLKSLGARRVIDFGCGEGKLLKVLWKEKSFEKLVGMDVSYRALEIARERLGIEEMHDRQKERIALMQGSLTYKDKRLEGFDGATCIEVIEHLDPFRLNAFERVVFQYARPKGVIFLTSHQMLSTTSNLRPCLLASCVTKTTDSSGHAGSLETGPKVSPIAMATKLSINLWAKKDIELGPPTQMAVFTR